MEKLSITKIDQIGIVVEDIKKTIEYYSSTFGIGPFKVLDEVSLPNVKVHGKISNLKVRLAFAQLGRVQIELIEVIEGENIYTEFLKSKGEGLHHIGIAVDDVDKMIATLKEQGVGVLQEGRTKGESFAYLDTERIGGVIFELIPKVPLQALEIL